MYRLIAHNSIISSIMNKLKRNSDEISNLRVNKFRDVLWPVYYTLKLIGLLPFSLNSRDSPRCFMSKLDKIVFGSQVFFHLLFIVAIILRAFEFFMYGNNRILGNGWILCFLLKISSIIFYNGYQIYKLKEIDCFLKILNDFDVSVSLLGDYNQSKA